MIFISCMVISNIALLFVYRYALQKGETYQDEPQEVSLTGKELAIRYFQTYKLKDTVVKPYLKNFYDLEKKTIYLREDLYKSSHLVSLAVAAHECSHALQHKKKTLLSLLRIASFGLRNLSFIVSVILFFCGAFMSGKIMLTLASLYYVCTFFHEREANQYAVIFLKTQHFSEREHDTMNFILTCFLSSYFVTFLSVLTLLAVIWRMPYFL